MTACGTQATTTPTVSVPTAISTAISTVTANPATPTPTPQTVVVQRVERPTAQPGLLTTRATPSDLATTLPMLAAHLAEVRTALAQPVPVLPLAEVDGQQQQAQALALQDPRFLANARDLQTDAPLRNEIFGIYPVRPSDITEGSAACTEHPCYRVEMYNYARNLSTIAIVDLDADTVLTVNHLLETQPDIPPHLTLIAQEIAANAPEVIDELGGQPALMDATMANSKTALNASRCERSHHLCVAPTFMQEERALWAIVDLTEGTVVGVRWTELGAFGGQVSAPTEKELQDEVVTREFCEKSNALAQSGWQFDYILTSSDGLRISNVTFNDAPVLESAKLVDWHVSYSQQEGFGYSDAIGCPIFSQAAVVAFNGPQVVPIRANGEEIGFALTQDYQSEFWPVPCNYYYSQRYEFYQDGRFRIAFANHGRGCGNQGTYRPVARIVPANAKEFAAWDGSAWQPWQDERWTGPFAATTTEGYQFRLLTGVDTGYYIEPGRGQFDDGGRGDNPYVYVTHRHTDGTGPDEGDSDLITIGPCCNTDYQQGPEKFIDTPPESIADGALVFWYVAQLENDDTPGQEYCWADVTLEDGVYIPIDYPCFAGPMFVPVE
ncbi:MAG: hypothetical protein KDE19_05765 [Caldilineaceae bacterium]|nr:hypothetical protein [Caldilineaceae bacterium]